MANKSTFDDLFTSRLEIAPLYMGYNSKDEEITFFVKETGNKDHEKVQRKYAKMLERSRKNQKRHRAIMAKIVAESILDSWKGVLDKKGNEIEPTTENKIEALVRFKKLFFEVLDFASDATNFQGEEDDDEEGTELDDDGNPISDDENLDKDLTPEEDTEKN